MENIPILSIRDLSSSEIERLAQILYAHPEFPHTLLEDLPKRLRPVIPFQRQIFGAVRKHLTSKDYELVRCAKLCKPHSALDPQLIGLIFDDLRAEIGTKLANLVWDSAYLSALTTTVIEELQDLNSLWHSPNDFRKAFSRSAPSKWPFEPSGCEACILSRIPKDSKTMAYLYAATCSRRQKGHPDPDFARFLDHWIRWDPNSASVFEKAGEYQRTLRHDRSDARQRRNGKPLKPHKFSKYDRRNSDPCRPTNKDLEEITVHASTRELKPDPNYKDTAVQRDAIPSPLATSRGHSRTKPPSRIARTTRRGSESAVASVASHYPGRPNPSVYTTTGNPFTDDSVIGAPGKSLPSSSSSMASFYTGRPSPNVYTTTGNPFADDSPASSSSDTLPSSIYNPRSRVCSISPESSVSQVRPYAGARTWWEVSDDRTARQDGGRTARTESNGRGSRRTGESRTRTGSQHPNDRSTRREGESRIVTESIDRSTRRTGGTNTRAEPSGRESRRTSETSTRARNQARDDRPARRDTGRRDRRDDPLPPVPPLPSSSRRTEPSATGNGNGSRRENTSERRARRNSNTSSAVTTWSAFQRH